MPVTERAVVQSIACTTQGCASEAAADTGGRIKKTQTICTKNETKQAQKNTKTQTQNTKDEGEDKTTKQQNNKKKNKKTRNERK